MRNEKGFTLIELLIVVVIIGILAAIAIPQFASTKEKAFDAAAKSDLRNMMTAQEAYFSDFQAYTTVTVASGGSASINGTNDFQASTGVALGATAATDGFSATAAHSSSSETWCINTSAGATTVGKILKATSC
jgi:prepilin-type N-terminal cleavage/methylation domain-containing protein